MATKPQPNTMSKLTRCLVDFTEAMTIDLPIAATKRILARTDERELHEAGWKAYDAIVELANDATSRVYTNSAFGRVAAGAMEATIRAQRLGVALSGALFANLWPAIGLPTAAELSSIREEVGAMRAELAVARAPRAPLSAKAQAAIPERPASPRFDVETAMMATSGVFQRPMFSGWTMPEGREITPREVKQNVSN